ncbi:M24 family metallopeptidase [Pedococcus sp. 5OH_020]|uniref:M24 family metallopeptidase n=1 Tax=Pedococcus sp. 5OH_020 TaxID=2989814 RepID=UPI0022E9E83C|nr:M24 family metallopeptidase [Pedococcus sp. 5OH_020]
MPTSTAEPCGVQDLTQRWERLWTGMEQAALDVLLVHGTGALGQYGNLVYVLGSHLPTKGAYAVLRRGAPPVLVASSAVEGRALMRAFSWDVQVVAPVHSGRAQQLAQVAELCGGYGAAALAGPSHVPHGDALILHMLLEHTLPVVDLVSEARRALAQWDQDLMRAEATTIEQTFQSLPALVRPKDTERDLAAAIESQLVRRGSRVRIVHVSAGHFHGQPPSDSVLRAGAMVTIFIESAGATGHWVELGVIAHVGTPGPTQRHQTELLQAALRTFPHQLMPGRDIAAIVTARTRVVSERDAATIGLGHGTGVDEQPWQLGGEVVGSLRAGEAVAVHPSLEFSDGTAAAVANTFLVGPAPAEPLSQLPFTTLTLPPL